MLVELESANALYIGDWLPLDARRFQTGLSVRMSWPHTRAY